MSLAVISPSVIRGTLTPPPSKSAAHRALLCAALAGGGTVRGITDSEDMQATLRALPALGALPAAEGETVTFSPTAPLSGGPVTVDCGESGSTLRFLIPLFASHRRVGHGCSLHRTMPYRRITV